MNAPTNTTSTIASPTPWTPARQARADKSKPVRLLELGEGPHGKTALFEFPEDLQRAIDLPTQADGWHPLFNELPNEDGYALRRHVLQPVVTGPDGKRSQSQGLSFTTCTITRRGNTTDFRLFDVPAEGCSEGSITGYRCAAELLEALQRGYGPYIDVRGIIKEASEARLERLSRPSRASAAFAFLDIVVEAMKFLANHSQHGEFIARKIEEAEHYGRYAAEQEAKEKAAFVERMRQARAAKRSVRDAACTPSKKAAPHRSHAIEEVMA